MNIWTIALILGAIVLLVGPIAMMQPSPRQRRLEKLRTGALELGMIMRLDKLNTATNPHQSTEVLPHYILPVRKQQSWQLNRAHYEHESHVAGWWEYSDKDRPSTDMLAQLTVLLPKLPNSVKGVSCSKEGFGVFWTEQGNLDDLTALCELLKSLRAE